MHAPHLWLNRLVETGPLGLLAIVAVTAVAWASAGRAARAGSVHGTFGLASLTGFFRTGMLDDPANLDRISMLFWLALGVVTAEAPGGRRRRRPVVSDDDTMVLTPVRQARNGPRPVAARTRHV
ncbi:hypothetical protein ACWDE0_32760 [Streptomyces sp. 900105755]